jgi:hypothetical protein
MSHAMVVANLLKDCQGMTAQNFGSVPAFLFNKKEPQVCAGSSLLKVITKLTRNPNSAPIKGG